MSRPAGSAARRSAASMIIAAKSRCRRASGASETASGREVQREALKYACVDSLEASDGSRCVFARVDIEPRRNVQSAPQVVDFIDMARGDIANRPEGIGLAIIDASGLVILVNELFFYRYAGVENHPPCSRHLVRFADQFAFDQRPDRAATLGTYAPAQHAGPIGQQHPDLMGRRRDSRRLVDLGSLDLRHALTRRRPRTAARLPASTAAPRR